MASRFPYQARLGDNDFPVVRFPERVRVSRLRDGHIDLPSQLRQQLVGGIFPVHPFSAIVFKGGVVRYLVPAAAIAEHSSDIRDWMRSQYGEPLRFEGWLYEFFDDEVEALFGNSN